MLLSKGEVSVTGFKVGGKLSEYPSYDIKNEGVMVYQRDSQSDGMYYGGFKNTRDLDFGGKDSIISHHNGTAIAVTQSGNAFIFKSRPPHLRFERAVNLTDIELCNEDSCINLAEIIIEKEYVNRIILYLIILISSMGLIILCICCMLLKF